MLSILEAGDDVVAADILPPEVFAPRPDAPPDRVRYVQLDVADPDAWTAAGASDTPSVLNRLNAIVLGAVSVDAHVNRFVSLAS